MAFVAAFRYDGKEYYTDLTKEISFGTHKKDTIKIPESSDHLLVLNPTESQITVSVKKPLNYWGTGSSVITVNEVVILSGEKKASLYVSQTTGQDSRKVELPYNGTLTCGSEKDNDIIIDCPIVYGRHFLISCENRTVHIEDFESNEDYEGNEERERKHPLYLNGIPVSKAVMKSGDVLSIYTLRFLLRNGELLFENMGSALDIKEKWLEPERKENQKIIDEKVIPLSAYLTYHLSPRTREQLPKEEIILSAAPGQMHAGRGQSGNIGYLLGSGAMMAASLASGGLSPALLLMRAAGLISPVTTMALSRKMRKEEREQLEEYEQLRQESYRAYISDQKARIEKVADVQRRILEIENRSPEECLQTVQHLHRSLWERLPEDSDFLTTRLGIGKVPLCVEVKSRADADGFRMEENDELEELSSRIIEETRHVDSCPVCISLRDFQTIGIVGKSEQLQHILRNIVVELATQHSFLDVHFVGLFEEEWMHDWQMLCWLPHIWDETVQTRYIAFNKETRHFVCEMLSELIRRRKANAYEDGRKREQAAKPHFIVVVQNREFLYEENIFDAVTANDPTLGITTLILADSLYNLPQTCQLLIEPGEREQYCVYERQKYDQKKYFTPDIQIDRDTFESFCRRQAAIELEMKGGITAIPSSVTFLQGYQVQTVEELHIEERWENSKPYASLAAPIGIMEGGKTFSLDIRSSEQAHGPHGLLAGTTGSGKSELLQSWILSMAVNYHPHDVNFVIIDYKGGGMSDLVEPLPHVVGKITNIDRNITRSLISLKGELKRRQKLFAEYGVNNIDKYQRAFEEGIAKERLPHLIIVTDEFAELKKEEPEFMAELNSVATIGRSLGIHMLLATQKPAGVVTDQINSNSRFRICMKVQDVADSREMIKRADAALITQAGRAYVRVGEDEYFGLFQSFYSAAEYTGNTAGGMQLENQVRLIKANGNRIMVNKRKQKKKSREIVDELTAVTACINDLCKEKGIKKLPGPWLPELPRRLLLTELGIDPGFDGTAWKADKKGLRVPIGKYDIPEEQKQGIQYLDFMETGHYGIYGIPGSGKTTLLKTVLTAIGMYYKPEHVNVWVLDAANWSMSEFAGMPHVKKVILNQEKEEVSRFISRMRKEMEYRRSIFLKAAVNSLDVYWEIVSKELPAVIIAVDHIEALFEEYMELGELFAEIATSGAAFGMYLIYTANSTIGIRYAFLQLIKGAITLQMSDRGDYGSLVGPIYGVSLPQFAGRALIKGAKPVVFQAAMYIDGENEKRRQDELEKLFISMKNALEAEPEKDASAQPETNTEKTDYGRGKLFAGRDIHDFEPVVIDLTSQNVLLLCSEDECLRENMLGKFEMQLSNKADHQIVHLEADNVEDVKNELGHILDGRVESLEKHQSDPDFDQEKWITGFSQICLIIHDPEELERNMGLEDKNFIRQILTDSSELGVLILVSAPKTLFEIPKPDLIADAILSAGQVLALDGRPTEYVKDYERQSETTMINPLEENEIAWIKTDELKIMRI